MYENFSLEMGTPVPQSFSRRLDNRVADQEMPYGYNSPAPPADSGDYDIAKLNSRKQYPAKRVEHERY